MVMRARSLLTAMLGLGLLGVGACSRTPAHLQQPGINPNAGRDAVQQFDADKDGKITGNELDKVPALRRALESYDTNGDGGVSADEIDARVAAWKESELGRRAVMISVTRNGAPLEGATLKAVPEKFLGEEIQPAEGTTDEWGVVMPSVVAAEDAAAGGGMQVGLYRVEITKPGDQVPANYNSESELGFEVAQDPSGGEGAIYFDLKY